MKKLLALLVLVSLGLTIGCGGASGPAETAEGVAVAALEAMQSGDKEAYMSLAYPGEFEGGMNMKEYEELWQELEEDSITIDTWSEPLSVESIPDSDMEGDIIGGEIMETMVSFSAGDGEVEAEGMEIIVVQTEAGWYIFEIDI